MDKQLEINYPQEDNLVRLMAERGKEIFRKQQIKPIGVSRESAAKYGFENNRYVWLKR